MDNLGELLRQARLEKGKTLEEIAEETKIRIRYLQAIEEGNLDILPGHFYTRGFIKSYAEAVGLDPDALLKTHLPEEREEDADSQVSLPPRRVRHQSYRVQPKPAFFTKGFSSFLLVAFVGLIVVVIYWFMTSQSNGQNGQTLPPGTMPNVTVEDNEPTSPPLVEGGQNQQEPDGAAIPGSEVPKPEPTDNDIVTNTGQLILLEEKGQDHVYALTGGKLAIYLEATGRCWVELRANDAKGQKLYSGELQPGETLVWPPGEEETVPDAVRLRIGAPSAIQLTISGHSVETSRFSGPQNFIIRQAVASQ